MVKEIEIGSEFHLPRLKDKQAFFAMRNAGMEYTFGLGIWKIPEGADLETIAKAMSKWFKGFTYTKTCQKCGEKVYGLEDLYENFKDHELSHTEGQLLFPFNFELRWHYGRKICPECGSKMRGKYFTICGVTLECVNCGKTKNVWLDKDRDKSEEKIWWIRMHFQPEITILSVRGSDGDNLVQAKMTDQKSQAVTPLGEALAL